MFDLAIETNVPANFRRVSRRELFNFIADGEGPRIEFKRHFTSPEKIAKEMIAFANSKGGVIIFGVDDDRSIVGVESEKSELAEIEHTAEFLCEPPIKLHVDIIRFDSRHDLIVVSIPESEDKPHTLVEYDRSGKRIKGKQQGFVRIGEKSVQASDEVMRVMRSGSPDEPPMQISFGHNEKTLIDYLHKYEKITVAEFADLVNISRGRAAKILVDLVRAGVVLMHTFEMKEFYTLAE
jgi:predicted HTH transcriptional regulator